MAIDLCKGSFQPNFAKKGLKMTKSSNVCQSFIITAEAFKILGIILRVMYISKK